MGFYRTAPPCSAIAMKIALVTGLLAHQVIFSVSLRSSDCVSIKEACVSESHACRSGWDMLKKVCRVSGESCRVVDSEECNMTIAYLLGQFPDWKGCLCIEEDYCRTPQLLAPNCHSQPGGETPYQAPSGRGWFQPDAGPASVSPEGQGCLSVLLGCQESPRCWSAFRKLRNCSSGEDQCRTLASRSSCLLLWGELKSTPLANCTCPVGGKRCLKVQALLQNSPCIQEERESLAKPLPKAIHQNMGKVKVKKDPKPDWQRSGLLEEARDVARSCLRSMAACMYDAVCNAQLVPLVRACAESRCESAACGRATRTFYRGLPRAVADTLVFCECRAADPDCLRVRAHLQGGACAGRPEHTPTCLELYDRCLLEPLCRQRYRTFQSRCFGEGVETRCADRLCPPDPDLIPGGDTECRWAFVGTMGTVLQQPCHCEGLQGLHLLHCQRIRQVFQERYVFISHMKKEVSSHHTTQENTSPLSGQRFSDQLFVALICVLVIVLILMVVITVLSTSGLCRGAEKAKFHPPDRKNIPAFH
ncbi:GDNF family receptor alpha-like isoform X2 [Conger conger]|uniref:GDNF family receptor alpha-like isoform X2 n=1 Tax=Conger conger TaxID=82655 RepID=UPI002A5AA5A1|nr:GDNF family receptor alpha-like isoform X2 [Conger conger]